MRRGVTCETDDVVSTVDRVSGINSQREEIHVSNEMSGEGDDSINVHQLDSLGSGTDARLISPVYGSSMMQSDLNGSGTTQDRQAYTDSVSVRSHEYASPAGARTLGYQDPLNGTTDFSLDDQLVSQQQELEHEMAAHSYFQVLRDILGSSAASPTTAEDVLMDGTGDNIWDQCLNAGQPFADLTGFSFIDLAPFDTSTTLDTAVSNARQENSATFETTAPAAATQAFHVSGWNWGPSPSDNETAETTNLILPSGEPLHSHLSTQSPTLLKQEDRSRLLSMLLQHCGKEQWVRIASTFPSEQFLNHLLQAFYALQGRDTLSWLHLPTIKIEGLRAECLAAMVGTAACFSLNRSVQRFGYVLPELVRFAVIDQVGHVSYPLRLCLTSAESNKPASGAETTVLPGTYSC